LTQLGFQSHFGLILSWCGSNRQDDICKLSIPFWSDFILTSPVTYFKDFTSFNPVLVWFYQNSQKAAWSDNNTAFNPVLVWFYPCSLRRLRRRKRNTFNPVLVWFYLR